MKNILYIFAVVSLSFVPARVKGQGTLLFDNRNLTDPFTGDRYHARVTLPDGSGAGGDAFTAGLYLAGPRGLELISSRQFRSTSADAAGYFAQPGIVSVPGVPTGAPATFRVRVWETSAGSYENAIAGGLLYGEFATGRPDNNLFVPALGPLGGPFTGPDLYGIQPLTLIPEPSALAMLALAGLISLVLKGGRKTNS